MKLKFYFLLLTILLVAVWSIMLVIAIERSGWAFYAVEVLITLSLIFLFIFYRKVVKPLQTIGNGMELLREQDFSSRLTTVGQVEADRIVQVFNKMMDQLKNERLRLREQNHFLDLLISASPMGVIILTFDGEISMINKAALCFLGNVTEEDVKNLHLKDIDLPLIDEIEQIPLNSTQTIRLSDSMIYRCY